MPDNNRQSGEHNGITIQLINHLIESGHTLAEITEKVRALHEDVNKLPNIIAREGSAKCDKCPARSDLLQIVTRRISEDTDSARAKRNKKTLWDMLYSIVSNKYLWLTLFLVLVAVLFFFGFDIIGLFKATEG